MYPHRKHIYEIFLLFAKPQGGVKEWFKHVDDNVHWTVTGQHRFAGTWTNKESYYNASWAKVNALLQDPGYRFEVPGGEEGIIVGQDGWSTVELKTIDVKTKSGVPYEQHYSWHFEGFFGFRFVVEGVGWGDGEAGLVNGRNRMES
ncbi:hypothetical protein CC86DRAFT_375511 [Ophiobolus disseminans]|uniref:SnoaL-like domain-containing protein n=1 Tax=Ophiobolus disseminans TaxID=1469910 RepID=A0A6A6ZF95_9PLEO|nr:hypothetical protein CC86DRAFT_375511 [Ophiobolus disseminans]